MLKMKSTNKNMFNRILLGLKIGMKTVTLPEKINNIHKNPLIRIFRFIGGICIILVVYRNSSSVFSILPSFPNYLAILVVIIAILHLFYILF